MREGEGEGEGEGTKKEGWGDDLNGLSMNEWGGQRKENGNLMDDRSENTHTTLGNRETRIFSFSCWWIQSNNIIEFF